MSTSPRPDSLRNQLQIARFERGLEVAESLASHRALLTTSELARLNRIINGLGEDADPWRQEAANVTLPSGRVQSFSIIENPVPATRDRLHTVTEQAEAGAVVDAAAQIYIDLVLSHVFKDGNRRTAVLAAHYFLRRYGMPLSALAIHELGLPDLHEPGQIELLRATLHHMAKFASKR
jgi:hypothetical protein